MKIDFHVHTKYSIDSLIEPKALAQKSRKLGIIPAIADHNSILCHKEMEKLGASFIPGEEISTDRGDLIGLYLNEQIARKTPFLEAIDLIRGQGGIPYLPHMFDYGRSGKHASESEAAEADIVEIFNARCMKNEYNLKAEAFAINHQLLKAVGSDSHFLFEFGKTYAAMPDFDIEDPKALIKALKAAEFITKKAPVYVRGTTTFVSLGKKLVRSLGIGRC
ncbi:MAG: PHP-associated domain-containing protein [Candidatus Micrarchaeota archaeon]